MDVGKGLPLAQAVEQVMHDKLDSGTGRHESDVIHLHDSSRLHRQQKITRSDAIGEDRCMLSVVTASLRAPHVIKHHYVAFYAQKTKLPF